MSDTNYVLGTNFDIFTTQTLSNVPYVKHWFWFWGATIWNGFTLLVFSIQEQPSDVEDLEEAEMEEGEAAVEEQPQSKQHNSAQSVCPQSPSQESDPQASPATVTSTPTFSFRSGLWKLESFMSAVRRLLKTVCCHVAVSASVQADPHSGRVLPPNLQPSHSLWTLSPALLPSLDLGLVKTHHKTGWDVLIEWVI